MNDDADLGNRARAGAAARARARSTRSCSGRTSASRCSCSSRRVLRALAEAGAARDARRRRCSATRCSASRRLIGADARVPSMVLQRAPLGQRGSLPRDRPERAAVPRLVGLRDHRDRDRRRRALRAALRRAPGVDVEARASARSGSCSRCSGPVGFVRRFVRKIGIWAVAASIVYLAVWILRNGHVGRLWHAGGHGGSFWLGVDLVIALTVSWVPLVADYTRFSRSRRAGVRRRRARLPPADALPVRLRRDPRALASVDQRARPTC